MNAFHSLEDLYARLDVVRDLPVRGAASLVDKLQRHRDAAFLARQLTRIRCDVELSVTREHLRRRRPDMGGIHEFCSGNGFGELLRRQAARLAGPI
jgi:DNA polymerase-1